MNMRVTRAEVIKTASDMADRNGLHNVSLKAIAENLGIRTPSLYNHKMCIRDRHRGLQPIFSRKVIRLQIFMKTSLQMVQLHKCNIEVLSRSSI